MKARGYLTWSPGDINITVDEEMLGEIIELLKERAREQVDEGYWESACETINMVKDLIVNERKMCESNTCD